MIKFTKPTIVKDAEGKVDEANSIIYKCENVKLECKVTKVIPFPSTGIIENVTIYFDKKYVGYVYEGDDANRQAIAVEKNYATLNMSQFAKLFHDNSDLDELLSLNDNRVDNYMTKAIVNANVTLNVTAYNAGDEYAIVDEFGNPDTAKHQYDGCNVSTTIDKLDTRKFDRVYDLYKVVYQQAAIKRMLED